MIELISRSLKNSVVFLKLMLKNNENIYSTEISK